MRIDRYGLVVVAVCWIAAACGDDDTVVEVPDSGGGGHDAGHGDAGGRLDAGRKDAGGGADEDAGGMADAGQRTIQIDATEYQFDPDQITAAPGETFVVVLRNQGAVEHNIEFDLPDGEEVLDDNLAPGDEAELTVTAPDATGDYDFFCPIVGHRALGMEGTLVVE